MESMVYHMPAPNQKRGTALPRGRRPVRSEPRGLAGQTDAHMMHKWCGGVHVVMMMMMMMLVMGNQAHTL